MLCAVLAAGALPEARGQTDTASPDLDISEFDKMEETQAELPDLNDTDGFSLDLPEGEGTEGPRHLRFSLGHEFSLRTRKPSDIVNNRTWGRVEYSRFFDGGFYARLDTKLNAYWSRDHRARAVDRTMKFEQSTPEAYLQYSPPSGRISMKLGVQRMIWGESEAGAITDEVSPRNLSELFFVPLEESRLGQMMVAVDHYSSLGDLTAFFVPRARFNKYPSSGSAYYTDPFGDQADVHDDLGSRHEFGMRWRRATSGSDYSVMAASLIDNDPVYRFDGMDSDGRMRIAKQGQRFTMLGTAFNHAMGRYLLKGEVAYKTGKAFNNAELGLIRKDVIDASLGVTYSLGQSNTVGVELVNRHVLGWTPDVASAPRNTTSIVLNTTLMFLNETLTVNWLTIYNRPYTSWQSSLRTSYKWSDNLTYSLDLHAMRVSDERSGLYPNRRDHQVFLRAEYKF